MQLDRSQTSAVRSLVVLRQCSFVVIRRRSRRRPSGPIAATRVLPIPADVAIWWLGYLRRMFDLSGKTAVVTGAGQNVGAGIARLLAAQGATVHVNDIVADRAQGTVDQISTAGGAAPGGAVGATHHT